MNVIVTGGGTGGHLYPALNIAKQIVKTWPNAKIIYFGAPNSIEEEIVTKTTNFEFIQIDIEGLKSIRKIYKNVQVLNKFVKASNVCKQIMKQRKIAFVIGTGGYVCAPVFAAAKKLKINYYIHEQNCVFGKVVKFYKNKANATFTSFETMLNHKNIKPNEIFAGNPQSYSARQIINTQDKKDQVIIYSGSMGGYYFNKNFEQLYETLGQHKTKYIHIVGKNHELKKSKYNNIEIIKYSSNLLQLINESKYVICRGGASTIAELIGLKKPAIIVPSPYVAHKHQHVNASYLTRHSCALICEEEDIVQQMDKKILLMEQNLKQYSDNFDSIKVQKSLNIIINKIKGDLDAKNCTTI